MPDRLLVRHFLQRFLDHDLVSPQADRRDVLTMTCGGLVSASLFVAVLLAVKYQFSIYLPPGLTAVFALDDRFLLITACMLVMALVAVAQWDALALDARDTAVLGVLPIRRSVIVRAKFGAVALFAVGFVNAWTAAPALLRSVSLPARLPVTPGGVAILMLAHAVTSLAAGAFAFLAVLALRETLRALLGAVRFAQISAAVQAVLVVACTTALLLLPGSYSGVARGWLSARPVAVFACPPLWFVGLHESLAGAVLDGLPRSTPFRMVAVPERAATALYRSLWPRFHALAAVAVLSLVVVTLVTIAACAWNTRRLPMPLVTRTRPGAVHRAWVWVVTHVIARPPAVQAGFFFTTQTSMRSASHRVTLATALAVGLAMIVVVTRGRWPSSNNGLAALPLSVLTAQTLLLAAVVGGFQRAALVPAELRANWIFQLSWAGEIRPYLQGVKRAGWVLLVLPALAGIFFSHVGVLGFRLALLHVGVGAAVALLLMEAAFLNCRRLPFAARYAPAGNLPIAGVLFLIALSLVAFGLAWVERSALATPTGYGFLIATILGLWASVQRIEAVRRGASPPIDFDEAAVFPTQRLDLAR